MLMKLFRRISRFLITYLVVLSVSSCLYAESVTVAVANSSSYAVDRTIRFSKRCGMKAEQVKSANININKYDGLILPGGSDVSPSRYGQKTRNRHTYGCSGKLDDFQITLVRMFAAANKPILGICRGCQVINVAFGGTLKQHVGWRKGRIKINVLKNSRFYSKLGSTEKTYHHHHQALDKIGTGLIVTMTSHAGKTKIAEGIRHMSLPIIAVQWHPENTPKGTEIGKAFKEMCLKSKNQR